MNQLKIGYMVKRIIITIFMLGVVNLNGFAQETGTFTDPRDGKIYKTVKIGAQTWMAENLAYLPEVSPPASGSNTDPVFYVYGYEGNDVSAAQMYQNYKLYGVLFNWQAAKRACPQGWHLPSDEEWKQMEIAIGMHRGAADQAGVWRGSDQGTKLKSQKGWYHFGNGTDEVGFKCLPAGQRFSSGHFDDIEWFTMFWTSTVHDSPFFAKVRKLTSEDYKVYRGYDEAVLGLSVRCVKD
jgi:uncharacterized protein (TIGR02145 family)